MNNQNDTEEAKQAVIKKYDADPLGYDRTRTNSPSGQRLTQHDHTGIARHLDLPPGSRVLEVGCGTGRLMAPLRGQGWDQLGTDASPAMLRRALSKSDEDGSRFQLVISDAEELPFKDGSFDGVYTFNTVFWLPNLEMIISEMYRITKPGGKVAVDFSNALSPLSIFGRLALRRKSDWRKHTLSQLRNVLKEYHYDIHVHLNYSPTLWRAPVLGRLMPIIERYVPLPRFLANKYVCVIHHK